MVLNFSSVVRKANESGTGFIQFPKKARDNFEIDSTVNVLIKYNSRNIEFFGRIKVYDYKGIYVSRKIAEKQGLVGKEVFTTITKIRGFHVKTDSDGKVYFPTNMAENLNLMQNSIVMLTLQMEQNVINKYCRIDIRQKIRSREYYTFMGPEHSGKEVIITADKLPKSNLNKNSSYAVTSVLKDLNFSFLANEEAVIIEKHKPQLIVSTKLSFDELAHYLGAYFADGTKKGNSWAICASTFEQAKYYLDMHKSIVKNSSPKLNLSFTTHKNSNKKLLKWLKKQWLINAKIELFRVWLRKSKGVNGGKYNEYGTLVIREHRLLILLIYNKLLHSIINHATVNKKQVLAIKFILGILEGDGSSSAEKRGHITISTNRIDVSVVDKMLKVAKFKYKIYKESEGRYYIRIGSLEMIKKLPNIYQLIFRYYPKRRQRFFKRFIRTGTAQYILGNKKTTSGWIKADLQKNKILKPDYELTNRGKLIKYYLNQIQTRLQRG